MKRVILTANYKDRRSENRWLTRNEDQTLDQTVAHKAVFAKDVRFEEAEAEKYEGCHVVASCGSVEPLIESIDSAPKDFTELVFCQDGFYEMQNLTKVDTVEELYLTEDGSMYGKMPVAVTA